MLLFLFWGIRVKLNSKILVGISASCCVSLVLAVGSQTNKNKLSSVEVSPIIINQVSLVLESANQYTLQFEIKNNKLNIDNWQFGFFMLKVLQNPALKYTAQICDNFNNCSPLQISTNLAPKSVAEVNQADLTSGHVAIFKPTGNYSLRAGSSYTMKLAHLVYPPKNISMMPQSFFILNNKTQFQRLLVENYLINGYSESSIMQANQLAANQHWLESESLQLVPTPIIPRPQLITYLSEAPVFKANFPKVIVETCRDSSATCTKLNRNPEGYILSITPSQIKISAYNPTGVFYARQSLAQLSAEYPKAIPAQKIIDYPSYPYRGIMVDVARHFIPLPQLDKIIDVMAAQKLNTLHLHLADDEAWRVELNNYPLLTQVSSQRYLGYRIGPSNLVDGNFDLANTRHIDYANAKTNYSGYYTESQIKYLIKYANSRKITIIPEIEMPGHARAMKKAYPEVLYDFKQPSDLFSVQGYNDNVLPIHHYHNDIELTNLINGITHDLAQLFTHQNTIYAKNQEISLSGDEVPANAYPNTKNGASLNHQFFTDLASQLPQQQISGWQQLVQNDDGSIPLYSLNPDRVGHIWEWMPLTSAKGVSGGIQTINLLKNGYPVVVDFADYAYLDMRYNKNFFEPGLYWASAQVDTWKTFSLASQLSQFSGYPNFLGVEGALWTELVAGDEHLWYMLLPKMTGIAETGWSNSANDSWQDFAMRLGDGSSGFLSFLSQRYKVTYRGYPYGINLELPESQRY